MTLVRIFGIGSPFGDDRIGWEVIEALRKGDLLARFPAESVVAECCDRPSTRLIPLLANADFGILVDAMRSDSPPGTIRRLTVDDIESAPDAVSCHGFGLGEALELARALGTLPPRLVVFGVELGQAGPGDGLSAAVQAAIPHAAKLVMEEINASLEADARASARTDAPNPAAP
ncbi:MAG: hydrogenase maturation protease [Betaproteobacteria bacterium]|jgi:hydrogenase maturation protease|nr:hydrogenase maturation protease [Betaproteobacteria bacterium]